MRHVLFLALSIAAASALAQQQRPPNLEPLPEAPPPPLVRDGADEPRVRIAPQEGDRVEEVRDGGRVVMLKVTPPGGAPYYLLDPTGSGNWTRRDALDPGIRVPMWTIKTFD
ncbi:MAG: hypothetical protein A2W21_13510 [Betaproteobacteria bacterium RBG_16_66_20]|nr:MAG: hypothetical protein A2W21_13510 [Betaproteobacteria bacterium RBG_16_66_20]